MSPGFLQDDDQTNGQQTPNYLRPQAGAWQSAPYVGQQPAQSGGSISGLSAPQPPQSPQPSGSISGLGQQGGYQPPQPSSGSIGGLSGMQPAQQPKPQSQGDSSGITQSTQQPIGGMPSSTQPQQPKNGMQGNWNSQQPSPQTRQQNGQMQRRYYGE